MTDERPVAWLETARDAPVLDRAGRAFGRVHAVLGDDEENIFHGIAVKLDGGGLVEVPGDAVERITTKRVYTALSSDQIGGLQTYEEQRWFDFDGLTRIFKRPKWEEDE